MSSKTSIRSKVILFAWNLKILWGPLSIYWSSSVSSPTTFSLASKHSCSKTMQLRESRKLLRNSKLSKMLKLRREVFNLSKRIIREIPLLCRCTRRCQTILMLIQKFHLIPQTPPKPSWPFCLRNLRMRLFQNWRSKSWMTESSKLGMRGLLRQGFCRWIK